MTTARPTAAPILALSVLLAGLVATAPAVNAGTDCTRNNANWDVEPGDDGWVRLPHHTDGPAPASRILRMQLFEDGDGPALGPYATHDWVNGLDAYVHDLGCQTVSEEANPDAVDTAPFCLASIPGTAGDGPDETPLLFDVEQFPQPLDRVDEWRVQFFSRNPATLEPTPVGETIEIEDTPATGGCDPEWSPHHVPTGARYAVIWLDSSHLAEPDVREPDAAENYLPRGYQTRAIPYGPYAAHFTFDVCVDQFYWHGGKCD